MPAFDSLAGTTDDFHSKSVEVVVNRYDRIMGA
jgi:hypothetical protein